MLRREGFRPFPRVFVAVLFGLVALVAAGWGAWMMTHGVRVAPQEAPVERATRQIREQLGRDAELRYAELGEKRAACGYVGRVRGGPAVGFVSLTNRILFSDDPLPTEFREMRERYCPGFLTAPPTR
ncbi:hypothetical protein [Brevundimonas sp. SL130]|uniref:hypothetical protein n=1 Tax=Brevundimonas sp. SL130 TaxID=2995143 RepID=UPI00226CD5EC|nr:hypothetical protein [Brevundimonas sp. SL130]WAC60347.1 hypothetical protein OU998_02555 [Brevundimonas sp. SL130]